MTLTPVCPGAKRTIVCGLCGRGPNEPCATRPRPPKEPPRICPACDGSTEWPRDSGRTCLVCDGTGFWKETA